MKLEIIIIVLACGVLNAQRQPQYMPGSVTPPGTYPIVPAYESGSCGVTFKTAVCKDCKNIAVCNGPVDLNPILCPPATPYCITDDSGDRCSPFPDAKVQECKTNSEFKCTGIGYFPDPFDCRTYHYCTMASAGPHDVLTCAPGYYYDTVTEMCKRQISPNDCSQSVTCSPVSLFSRYGKSISFYAYCAVERTTPIPPAVPVDVNSVYMFKCNQGTQFDGNTCAYKCLREGKFKYSADPIKYYECYFNNGALTYRVVKCPGIMEFDTKTSSCKIPPSLP